MIVGCYTMDLYCANWHDKDPSTCVGVSPGYAPQFTGQTEAQCKRQARKAGWKFSRWDAICPACAKALEAK